MSEQGVALCHGIRRGEELNIVKLEFAQVAETEVLAYVKGWVVRNKLKNADCYYVLSQDEYELELIESPPVEEDELREAVRWRLKDLLSLSIEEAAIDIFKLPHDAYRGRMSMLYVVASKKSLIEQKIAFIKQCGLDLKVIDIEEMAMRNFALFVPEAEQGSIAFLSMKENTGQIQMFSHEDMYLTREIEMGYASFIPEKTDGLSLVREDTVSMVERFVLDIQRSLDYYESQVGKGVAQKIYLMPNVAVELEIEKQIQGMLSQEVISFNCNDYVPFTDEFSPNAMQQALCLPAIGAVLRGGKHAAD